MTLRKFLFLNVDNYGYNEEAAAADSLELGGLTMSGAIAMGSQKITGLANGTNANDAVNRSQLDAAISGLTWKDPSQVLKIKSDVEQAGTPPTATLVGEAWVVDTWGVGYTDGDIVEWDGTQWNVVTAGVSSEPPDNTHVIVVSTGAAGSFSGQANKVGIYDADTDTWSFNAPSDGWASLVNGENSVFENMAFVYDATPGGWIQFTGPASIPDATAASGGGVKGKISVDSDYGLAVNSGVLKIAITADTGLQFNSSTKALEVEVNNAQAIHVDSAGLGLSINTAYGLEFSSNNLVINLEAAAAGTGGLKFAASGDTGAVGILLPATNPGLVLSSNGLDAKLKTDAGLAKDADGLYVVGNADAGITIDGDGVAVVLAAAGAGVGGLQFNVGGEIELNVNTDQGLHLDADGLGITLEAAGTGTGGLLFNVSGELSLDLDATDGALVRSSDGLAVSIDNTTIGINGSNQLYVKGAGDATRVSYMFTAGAGGIAKGNAVYISANDTVLKADKDAALTAAAIGVAPLAITATEQGSVVFSGIVTGILSGATAGLPYFVTDNGVLSSTIPTGASYVRRVGYAVNATDLLVMVGEVTKK